MRQRNIIIIIGVIILVGAGIWWWQSPSSDPVQEEVTQAMTPELQVASVRVSGISDDKIDVTAELILENTLPVDISTSSLEYEIFIDSIKVIQDVHDEPLQIASSDSTRIKLPLEILADPMSEVLDYFKRERVDSAYYSLEATVYLDIPVEGEEEFDFKVGDSLPTFQKLDINLTGVDPNILSSDDGLDVSVSIRNPNSYPTQLIGNSFSLTIREEMEVAGQMEDIIIPPGGTKEFTVHAEKEWGSMTQSVKDLIFNREDTRFIFQFNSNLRSENEVLDDTQFNLRLQGTLEELTNTAG